MSDLDILPAFRIASKISRFLLSFSANLSLNMIFLIVHRLIYQLDSRYMTPNVPAPLKPPFMSAQLDTYRILHHVRIFDMGLSLSMWEKYLYRNARNNAPDM